MRDDVDPIVALEADLAALAAAEADLERDAEVAERTRIERAALSIADRLRAASGPVEVTVLGGARVSGRVVEAGADAALLAPSVSSHAERHLVLLDAVVEVTGLGRGAAPVAMRPRGAASVLRSWCRDRAAVTVALTDGGMRTGLAGAAYADHLDLITPRGPVALAYSAVSIVSR